jgi:hypothetical protein
VIRRSFDPTLLNAVANHPEVRPWLGGDGEIDFTPLLDNAANVALVNEHGGWLQVYLDHGLYEVHSQFLPEGRGDLVADMRAALRYMFTQTDCIELVTRVPDGNLAAKGLARAAGFREAFRREACWKTPSGMVGVSFQTLPLWRWMMMDDEALARGQWFHDALEQHKATLARPPPIHADDEAHDRAVGASVLMFQAFNPHKAVASYNRWASFAGYAPIRLVSLAPLIIDVVDALVTMTATGGLEFLACQSAQSWGWRQ